MQTETLLRRTLIFDDHMFGCASHLQLLLSISVRHAPMNSSLRANLS
jgi:hypothetical protein